MDAVLEQHDSEDDLDESEDSTADGGDSPRQRPSGDQGAGGPPVLELAEGEGEAEAVETGPTQAEVDAKKLQIQQGAAGVVMVGVVLGFIITGSIAWTVLAGVCAVSMIEVVLLGGDGASVLRHTDGFLLVMICGLFVVIAGARLTGVPDELYKGFADLSPMLNPSLDSLIDVLAYSGLITVFSNICSNVPTVMLLSHTLRQDGAPTADGIVAWLMLSWASTVAGNLTLVGSIANLIVAEKASASGHELSFWIHLRFGFWSTILIVAGGCFVLFYLVRPLLMNYHLLMDINDETGGGGAV